MKIVILNYEFPPVGGGGGAASKQIGAWLVKAGHKVCVHTCRLAHMPKQERVDGMTVHRHYGFRKSAEKSSVWEMFLYLGCNVLPAYRHIRRWKPDLIHVHFAVPTGALAWLLAKLTRTPYVLTTHLGDVPGALPEQTSGLFRIFKPFTVPIWRGAAHVTAVSDHVRVLGAKAYGVPVTTVFNAIELPRVDLHMKAEHHRTRLVFAGRFNPQKNLLFLLEVLGRLKDLEWELYMIGDGFMRKAVEEHIEALELGDRVRLYGWQKPKKVRELMSVCDILFMPSHVEGLPVAAVEALSLGLALVGSDIGGMRDVVTHGVNGYLATLGNAEPFEEHLRELLTSPELLDRMKRKSLQRAEAFDIENIGRMYEHIFERALGSS
ncbi:MAG: glycosyltransferase family 4 protein [Acidobacteriota bacterium]|nr:glycosyltransferase family 4 protein [Acidobacteriota bacterium]